MSKLWQLYDDQGRRIQGKGEAKDNVLGNALLHASSHVWIWRQVDTGTEILLQKRAANKRTNPGLYSISAAGHIELGETPLETAAREAQEEISHSINIKDLKLIGVNRKYIVAPDNSWTENEFCWLYLLELEGAADFILADGEVESLKWYSLETMKQEVLKEPTLGKYTYYGDLYYPTIFSAIDSASGEE